MPTQPGKTLFSPHYLETRLPAAPEWAEDSSDAVARLQALYEDKRAILPTLNESQTEQEFVKPALEILGWSYIVQVKAGGSGSLTRPDYALFADERAKAEAYPHQGNDPAFYGRALAIAEAKYWGRPLSQKDADGCDTWKADGNPSHQMVSYLAGTKVPWGILTNGQTWRLYSREASSTASEFYEVDLEGMLAGATDFRRFYLFFRRAAFAPDATGHCFVERVADGSAGYAREISDRLKELVFREVMPEIAGGFVAYRREQLGIFEETDATLREIYAASLGLLYRLLFLLYAEARSLLPVEEPAYREESLTKMAQWAAGRLDRGQPISDATHATRQYDALLALFHRIDRGDPSLGVPRYDGGLFDPMAPENRFLEMHKLSDRAVAVAVDTLVRDAGQPVDYAFISVRNLGAIYEGLLDFRLRIANCELNATPAVLLESAADARKSSNPQSAIINPQSRKSSGSYYTPDYIVEYIVEQTLEPILEARAGEFDAAMDRIAGLRKQLARTADSGAIAVLRGRLEAAERDAREAFLGIKVCDPAMGSGHFLVNAVDHLTDGVIRRMQLYHAIHPDVPWEWNPVQRLIDRTREQIGAEMARQGIAVDPRRLDDTALLTRLVMKRCIYGVDLNRLAVELAKLSLWLHSFTVGAPLSFLDHHLRWGNSLIGSDVRTVEAAMRATGEGQFALFQGPFAGLLDLTAVMTEVAEQSDATLADVQESAGKYADFQRALTPYKQALDLWVSQYFDDRPSTIDDGRPAIVHRPSSMVGKRKGGGAAAEFLTLHADDVLPALRGEREVDERTRAAIERSRALWEEKRFFHWDLEFPEVFVDMRRRDWAEEPGFDAVIGNPPYVRQETLGPLKPFFAASFSEIYHGTADLFVYFFIQGLRQLKQGGRLAYISSNSWLRANYATALRAYLRTQVTVETLVDMGDNRVFTDAADVYPAIPVVRKDLPAAGQTAQAAIFTRGEGVKQFAGQVAGKLAPVSVHDQPDAGWQLGDEAARRIFAKLAAGGRSLGDVVEGRIYSGIKTGLNEAFIVDQATRDRLVHDDPPCAEIIRPIFRGEDLRPWYQENDGKWLIALPYKWTAKAFGSGLNEAEAWRALQTRHPSLSGHLAPFEEPARRRQDKGDYWWELRSCDYYDAFAEPKIFWPDISKFPRFSWDTLGAYVGNTGYIAIPHDPWLLGFLASRCTWFIISKTSIGFGERAGQPRFRLIDQYLRPLPIPDAPTPDRDAIAALALAITEQARARYAVDCSTRHRIATDLGSPGRGLNQKLTAWWELDFPGFLGEVSKALRRDIPLRQRDDWEGWLAVRRAEHDQRTAEIVRMETELNARVYALFDLTPAEIKIIEESTKYRYGEV
jgi:hypothetical protein